MNIKFISDLLTNISTPDGKPDYRKLIFPVASILVSIFIFFLLVIPQIMQLIENQNILSNLNTQIDNLDTKIASLNAISTPEFETNLQTVSQALPEHKDYIDSTPYIQEAIEKSAVNLTALSFSESPPTNAINSYQIKLDISGNLNQINQFLSLINLAPRILRVARIELSNSSQAGYSATISVSAYFAPIQKQNLALTQPVVNLSEQELEQIFSLEKNLKNLKPKNPSGQVGRSDPFN